MTKGKIFVGAGTLILAVTAFLTTSANKKYSKAVSAYFKTGVSSAVQTVFKNYNGSTLLTTVKGTHKTAFFQTVGGGSWTLYKSNSSGTLSGVLYTL